MRPLRITAVLQTGQVCSSNGRFTLDGLLSWVWFREHYPDLLEYGAHEEDWPDAELPLERRVPEHDPSAWYWAVSLGQYEPSSEYVHYWHRRFAADRERYIDLGGKKSGRINVKSGSLKSYRHPVPVILTPGITWYAVGDADELRRMLAHVGWIGKKRSQGFGWVGEWRIEPWHADWSERDDEGHRMRDVPVPMDRAEGFEGIRPPYWHRQNWFPVEVWDGPAQAGDVSALRSPAGVSPAGEAGA